MIQPPPPSGARYRQSRRRLLIDMHIPDWDPAFLGRFDPAELAAAVVGAPGPKGDSGDTLLELTVDPTLIFENALV